MTMRIYPDELCHYGILGMKWGVRNGPPYPLNSTQVAQKIFDKASMKAKKITRSVEDAADMSGGELHGLQHQLKTVDSIERKLNKKIDEKDMSVSNAANSIKDALRYTVIAPTENFVGMYEDFKTSMVRQGYIETSCDNYFEKFNRGEVKHKAVQSNFADNDGYEFEVQFHTPESQDAKDKKLPLYNERRSSGLSESRKRELEKQMEDLALTIPDPKGIESIQTHHGHTDIETARQRAKERDSRKVKMMTMKNHPDELAHFGILGMKWGVRRYQNPDGTLTEEGERRYGAHAEKIRGRSFRKQVEAYQNSSSNEKSRSRKAADEILKAAYSRADNTPEGKAFNKRNDEIIRRVKEAQSRGENYYVDKKTRDEFVALNNAYVQKVNEYIHSPEQQERYASALLRDLGYEDTELGRRYVSRMLGV